MTEQLAPTARLSGAGTIRVGTDLVSVEDVAGSIAHFGDRYLRRVFTPTELATCTGPAGLSPERLAARFAAKESVVKVLRPDGGVRFHDIEVQLDGSGRPEVVLHGNMALRSQAIGLLDASLSMSHDHGLATAVLVAVIAPPQRESQGADVNV